MRGRDIVVVGASAGGVETLMRLVATLPANFAGAICVVLHLPADGVSRLPLLLNRAGPLPASHPTEGQRLSPGHIYVAPPDRHLLVTSGVLHLSRGPRENHSRPAIDPLFRSAALAYRSRVVGVILSGTLDDGAAGLRTIKAMGGYAIVQDPAEAAFPGMPENALAYSAVDATLRIADIGTELVRLTQQPAGEERGDVMPEEMQQEVDVANFDPADLQDPDRPGHPSVFSCPECHGVLYEVRDGEFSRYRCRVGHAYASDSLRSGQEEAIEEALWVALRALEEKAELTRRLMRGARERNLALAAARYAQELGGVQERAAVLRTLLIAERDEATVVGPDEASA